MTTTRNPIAPRKTSKGPNAAYLKAVVAEYRRLTDGHVPWGYSGYAYSDAGSNVDTFHRFGATAIEAARMLIANDSRWNWRVDPENPSGLTWPGVPRHHYTQLAHAMLNMASRYPHKYSAPPDAVIRRDLKAEYDDGMAAELVYARSREETRQQERAAAEYAAWERGHAEAKERSQSAATRATEARDFAAREQAALEAEVAAERERAERQRKRAEAATRLTPEDLVAGGGRWTPSAEFVDALKSDVARSASTLDLESGGGAPPHYSRYDFAAGRMVPAPITEMPVPPAEFLVAARGSAKLELDLASGGGAPPPPASYYRFPGGAMKRIEPSGVGDFMSAARGASTLELNPRAKPKPIRTIDPTARAKHEAEARAKPAGKRPPWSMFASKAEYDASRLARGKANPDALIPKVGDIFEYMWQMWQVTRAPRASKTRPPEATMHCEVGMARLDIRRGDISVDSSGHALYIEHRTFHVRDIVKMKRIPRLA